MGLYSRFNQFDNIELDHDAITNQLAELPPPVQPVAPQPVEHSSLLRRLAGDTAVTALKGAIGLPESIVGIADIPTGGMVGKGLEYVGFRPREAKQTLDELYSPEQKAAFAKVNQTKGFLPTIQVIAENPSVAAHTALESAPSLLGAAGIARGAIKVLPKLAPFVAGAIGEGAISAGQTAEAIRGENPDHLLTPKQAALSGLSGMLTGGIGAAAGKFANKAGIANVETMLAGGSGKAINKGVARQIAEGALTEGMLEELPQSMQEQALQNIAQGKPWHEGVTSAGAQGMVTGGLMGAGGGGFNAAMHPSATVDTADQQQAEPPPIGPLSRAVATLQQQSVPQQGTDLLHPFDGVQIDPTQLEQQFAAADSGADPLHPFDDVQIDPAQLEQQFADAQPGADPLHPFDGVQIDPAQLEQQFAMTEPADTETPLNNTLPDVQQQSAAVSAVQSKIGSLIDQIRQGRHTPDSAFAELYSMPEYKTLSLQPQQQGDTAVGVDGDAEDYIYQQFEQAAAGQPRIKPPQPARPAPKVKGLNPAQHDLVTAIAKLGGLNRDQAVAQWGSSIKDSVKDLNLHATRNGGGGLQYAVHSKGKPLDTMRELLEEQGYLPPGSTIEDLYSKLEAATRGQHSYSQQHQASYDQDLSDLPFDLSDLNPELDESIRYALKGFDGNAAHHITRPVKPGHTGQQPTATGVVCTGS